MSLCSKIVPLEQLKDEHNVVGFINHAKELDNTRMVECLQKHTVEWHSHARA